MPIYQCPKCGRQVELPEGNYYCKVCGPRAIMRQKHSLMSEEMTTEEKLKLAEDIIKQLGETGQIYIIEHDTIISLSKSLYNMLDRRRRQKAREKGIPPEQYEWEDYLYETLIQGT